jgi:hypothetical protein
MTTGPASQCALCTHFRSPIGTDRAGPSCAAFPDGIPDRVYRNRLDHRQPIDGDHGIRWESDGGVPFPEYAFEKWGEQ